MTNEEEILTKEQREKETSPYATTIATIFQWEWFAHVVSPSQSYSDDRLYIFNTNHEYAREKVPSWYLFPASLLFLFTKPIR